jgi:hypothetical protein
VNKYLKILQIIRNAIPSTGANLIIYPIHQNPRAFLWLKVHFLPPSHTKVILIDMRASGKGNFAQKFLLLQEQNIESFFSVKRK